MTTQFRSKRHDTAVSPTATLTAPPGVSWTLQSPGVVVRIVVRLPDAATPKINAVCTVTGPWSVQYDPLPADVDTIGLYDVEFAATLGNSKPITFPNGARTDADAMTWLINPDYDNT